MIGAGRGALIMANAVNPIDVGAIFLWRHVSLNTEPHVVTEAVIHRFVHVQ